MPELKINDFDSSETLLTILITMHCYPDRVKAENFFNIVSAVSYFQSGVNIPGQIALGLVNAPSLDELPDRLTKNSQYAVIAGDILKYLYLLHEEGEKPSLYKAYFEVKSSYDGAREENKARGVGWSDRVLKHAWATYKPVAPLWAAFRTFSDSPLDGNMSLFLTRVNCFADFGENTQLYNKATKCMQPIFQKDEVFRPPSFLNKYLPKEKFTFYPQR